MDNSIGSASSLSPEVSLVFQKEQNKASITFAIGTIASLGALFVFLAAMQVLPASPNLLSQWKVVSLAAGSLVLAGGIAGMGFGIYTAYHLSGRKQAYERGSQNSGDSKSDLVEFLATQLEIDDSTQIAGNFFQLDGEHQGKLCARGAKIGKLDEVLGQIPKDVTELKISAGEHLTDFSAGSDAVKLILEELPRFTELKTLHVDLSGVAYYSEAVQGQLKSGAQAISASEGVHVSTTLFIGQVEFEGFVRDSNFPAAVAAINGLLGYLKKHESLTEIRIDFKGGGGTLQKVGPNNIRFFNVL
ncbi:MAG: hypothetical protein K940chlam9_00631 [Chlamydiae bacterium]|nr:hypothetical protein [Chlamydiota bacterium]